MIKLGNYIIAAVGMLCFGSTAYAQDYYDDIYGSPRREKTQTKKQDKKYQPVADYAPADSYMPEGVSTRDVDEYNRHGQFLVADSVAADTLGVGDTFAYTRRIEKYHNPDIVTESGDTTLCDYYYSAAGSPDVNIYIIDNSPNYYPYGWSWSWRYGNPWYWNVYGPAYIGWGGWNYGWYDPFWDPYPWGWNWGWSWGSSWGPSWGPAWGPGWGPVQAWRPTPAGSSRPHRPTVGNGYTPRPGAASNHYAGGSNTTRPGNMGRPNYGGNYNGSASTSAPRPGVSTSVAQPGTRPNASQGTYTPFGAGTRGRNSSGVNTNTNTNNTPRNYNNNNNNRNDYNTPSRSSYNSGSNRSSYSGGSSFGGGSHSTRGGGGSSSGGTGGGGRGRR